MGQHWWWIPRAPPRWWRCTWRAKACARGECHLALAGGVNLILAPETGVAFAKAGILSPDGRCKTFDAAADGMSRGEGCGIVVLKRLSDAVANRDHILAVLRGSAVNQDGPGAGLTVPNGMAQEALLRQTLAGARLKPAEVAYVEAHGTGTPLGDPIEIRAMGAAYCEGRPDDRPLLIGSVKTNFGHLEGAAGIAGLMKTILAVQHGEIPPHLHFQRPSPRIDWRDYPLVVPVTAVPWPAWAERRIAGVSAFGLSGTNAHLIVEQAPTTAAPVAVNRPPLHVLALSAKTAQGLQQLVAGYREWLALGPAADIADVCFSANTGRSHFPERLALVAASTEDIEARLAAVAAGQLPAQAFRGQAPAAAPKVAFLFTGGGSQYVGMGRELYKTQPVFRRVLDRCAAWLAPYLACPLLDVIYAPDGHSADLDDLQYMLPAIFALEMALAEMWKSWGVAPSAVMGHSLGEYAAACVAGVFSLEDGLRLVVERARLMSQLAGDGEMASVFTGEARVVEAMRAFETEVALAAVNGPDNLTISGRRGAVAAVCAALEAEGIKTNRLNVSQASHSPLMEPVLAPFEALVRQTRLATPRIPVISNVTGGPAAAELAEAEYWRRHLRQPVRFAEGMATLDRMGYSIFVEIGPKPVLLATGRRCLDGDGRAWLPSLRPGRGDWEQTLGSLAELYVRGVAVDWAGCEPAEACRRVALPTYPFQRQRYWFQPVEQPAQPLVYRATPAESRTNGGAAIPAAPAPAGHPRPDLTTPYIAPASEAEQQLARIWKRSSAWHPWAWTTTFLSWAATLCWPASW